MRFELAGSLIHPDPLAFGYTIDDTFDPLTYIELGYSHFEVICIGAGGGRGGGIDTVNTGTTIRNYGGAGGGGGYQRVRGLLSALSTPCPIVVGAAGSNGVNHASNPASTTDGGDGEASTFNNTTCRASGGEGGKRAQSNSDTVTTQADGGDGGIGNRIIAGGGAAGGTAGIPSSTGPGTAGTDGLDGTIFNDIGEGGGGGAGGVGKYTGVMCVAATSGGRGSYNPGDTSVYGPGGLPTNDPTIAIGIVPGKASGAKASPLNTLPSVYGQSGANGVVVIVLTADIIRTITPPVSPDEGTLFGALLRPIIFNKSVAGTKETFAQIASPFIFGKSVSGMVPSKATPIAEISLSSHAIPFTRTNHKIKVRARTTSGSNGVLKVALYEGATNRSGELTSSVLSNALADYTFIIPDAAASTITNYANLSIKVWGYQPDGASLVFEVAQLYLELPQ